MWNTGDVGIAQSTHVAQMPQAQTYHRGRTPIISKGLIRQKVRAVMKAMNELGFPDSSEINFLQRFKDLDHSQRKNRDQPGGSVSFAVAIVSKLARLVYQSRRGSGVLYL